MQNVVVRQRGAARVRAGHAWIYRSDIFSADGIAPGATVAVSDDKGKTLGAALYSSSSQIALRMISTQKLASDELPALLRQRIAAAVRYRERVVSNTDAYRVIFSEADFLPGLIVDRYHDLLSMQVLTQAMDRAETRAVIVTGLIEELAPAAIVERADPRIRELEQLPARPSEVLHGEKTGTIFSMNGVRFRYQALAGQKTGAFLDQRENYAAAAQYARGEALDVFCYEGGFALHLARVCGKVTGVDSSRPALEMAEANEQLNSEVHGGNEIEWIEANAFDLLKDYAAAGRQYDAIVLDPPPFARSKRALDSALRGYKELNLRALKMLRPGGILVSCSCSYHLSEAEFVAMLAEAAADARRPLRILEKRTQAKDHPILVSVPETGYLKCIICVAT